MKISKITKKDIDSIKKNPRKFTSLLNENKNFINKIVHKINSGKDKDYDYFLDCFQEGSVGLWNAVMSFKGEKDVSFSTYSYKCVYNAILQNVKKVDKKDIKDSSLEEFKSSGSVEDFGEYYENRFLKKQDTTYEDIEAKLDQEIMLSKMNKVDSAIYKSRINGDTLVETAKKANMNYSTFKVYYYKVFLKKMKKLIEEKLICKKIIK